MDKGFHADGAAPTMSHHTDRLQTPQHSMLPLKVPRGLSVLGPDVDGSTAIRALERAGKELDTPRDRFFTDREGHKRVLAAKLATLERHTQYLAARQELRQFQTDMNMMGGSTQTIESVDKAFRVMKKDLDRHHKTSLEKQADIFVHTPQKNLTINRDKFSPTTTDRFIWCFVQQYRISSWSTRNTTARDQKSR